jgi:hypothetical protein
VGEIDIEFKENDLIRVDDRYYLIFDAYIDGNEYVISVRPIKLKALFHTEAIEDIYKFSICKEVEE